MIYTSFKKDLAESFFSGRGGLALLGLSALLLTVNPARANLTITTNFTGSNIPADAQAVINNALKFYTDNITGNASVIVGFGIQAGGGASAAQSVSEISYTDYLTRLKANTAESATDVSALASLPASAPVGNGALFVTGTLARTLGFTFATPSSTFQNCGNQLVQACIAYSAAYFNGGPNNGLASGLFGVTQHEMNEVLGTSSALSANAAVAGNTGVNTSIAASPADLFRYAGANARIFSTNPAGGTGGCPSGTPAAYLSVDSGQTLSAAYNNCANGGDYGDFAVDAINARPQVYTGDENTASLLTLTPQSPELLLLDAIGYNIGANAVVVTQPPSTVGANAMVLAATSVVYGGPDDGVLDAGGYVDVVTFVDVPEPASAGVFALALIVLTLRRKQRVR